MGEFDISFVGVASSKILPRPLGDLGCAHGTGLPSEFSSVAKCDHGRDTGNAKCGRCLRGDFGIHFCQYHLWGKRFSRFGKRGSHHFAGTTPSCPKVNYDGYLGSGDIVRETAIVELDWVGRQQRVLTFTAYRLSVIGRGGEFGATPRSYNPMLAHTVPIGTKTRAIAPRCKDQKSH